MAQYISSPSERKCASEHLRRNKQKKSAGKKSIGEKKHLLKSMVRFWVRFCIAFVNILYCGMSNLIVLCGDQEMIWKLGICNRC